MEQLNNPHLSLKMKTITLSLKIFKYFNKFDQNLVKNTENVIENN